MLNETSLGGDQNVFPPTTQGILAGLQGADYRASLETFCARYWKPVYAYLRAAWAKDNDTAKDLTQAFFLFLTEDDALKRFDAARGSLRGYLKVLLRSFVGHQERSLATLKRGGRVAVVSLDTSGLDPVLSAPVDPEAIFERVWKTELVARAMAALERQGGVAFRIFAAYDLVPDGERPTYRELADRFRVSEAEVKNGLYRMREELRVGIRSELAQGTLSERDLEDEWKRLFAG
jgi:RNA polymerase sigma-70 factor (ECF subfamily)